ncbi:MAG: V-type ATPase subunit [Promethearchaeota archaeon]
MVPSYAYTYVKLKFLKKILIDDETLRKLRTFDDIEILLNTIKPFYPDINIQEYTIEEIEKSLYETFFKLIGKIIFYSPENIRKFLKAYLLQFEIMNIKQCILGSITGMSKDQKLNNINFLVEDFLGNTDFIRNLIEITSLEEIQLYMKKTKYNKAVREGILYFKNNNEIFVLEAFLDQLFYINMVKHKNIYNKNEKDLFNLYIDSITEIYNLNIIFRGIRNNIDKNLLTQFLIKNFLFLDETKILHLLYQDNIEQFFSLIMQIYSNQKDIKFIYKKTGFKGDHFVWWIESLYIDYFFKKFKSKIGDIDYSTIFTILEILIKKQKEIQFNIIPNIVRIIHKKFVQLEKGELK